MQYSRRTYDDLIVQFGEEKLEHRFLFLLSKAQHFVAKRYGHLFDVKKHLRIDETILAEVVLNYFVDIDRLKEFHGIDSTEPQKVAAYTAYWVARCSAPWPPIPAPPA